MDHNPYASPQQPVDGRRENQGRASWTWFALGMILAGVIFVVVVLVILLVVALIYGRLEELQFRIVFALSVTSAFYVLGGLAASGCWRGARWLLFKKHAPRRPARLLGGLASLPGAVLCTVLLTLISLPNPFPLLAIFAVSGIIAVETEVWLSRWFEL